MSEGVDAILYGFLQALRFGETRNDSEPDFPAALEAMRAHKTLRVETALTWTPAARSALAELLTQWLIVERLMMEAGTPLPYPATFCVGSSSTRLGEPFLVYIAERSNDLQSLARRSAQVKRERRDQH